MATVRYSTKQKRDADGKRLCKVCESPVPKGRKVYCGAECALRNNPGMIRIAVGRRDQGVCALCGLDTSTHGGGPRNGKYWTDSEHAWEADHIVPVSEGGGLCGLDGYRTLCRKCHGKESGALRKRLNERRRFEKAQREEGTLFPLESQAEV